MPAEFTGAKTWLCACMRACVRARVMERLQAPAHVCQPGPAPSKPAWSCTTACSTGAGLTWQPPQIRGMLEGGRVPPPISARAPASCARHTFGTRVLVGQGGGEAASGCACEHSTVLCFLLTSAASFARCTEQLRLLPGCERPSSTQGAAARADLAVVAPSAPHPNWEAWEHKEGAGQAAENCRS